MSVLAMALPWKPVLGKQRTQRGMVRQLVPCPAAAEQIESYCRQCLHALRFAAVRTKQLAHYLCVCAWLLQLLDEIGVDLSAAMGAAPQRKVAAAQSSKAAAAADGDSELQDLAARLATLRN